jgi:uncharacterized protein (DUF1810 family)
MMGKTMHDDDIQRFVEAQDPVYERVMSELRNGAKRSHWMWFVFPQLRGLGRSEMAWRFGIRDMAEARAYLAHPLLGERLRSATEAMLTHAGREARAILGQPDDAKFRSCLTLFIEAAEREEDKVLLTKALDTFFGGRGDRRTLDMLGRGGSVQI